MWLRIRLGYDFSFMRAMLFAAVIGLAVTSSAYAQAQSSAAMTVSVRVVRSCNIAMPGSPTDAPRITAQCASAAAPRTQVTAPAPASSAAAPTSLSEPRGDAGAVRVLTVNF